MIWVEVIISLILIFSFIGGLREGAIRGFFSLLSLFICIPATGFLYIYLADVLTFIWSDNWRYFIAFMGVFIILSIVIALILLIPGRMLGMVWRRSPLQIILGGIFNLAASAISIVLFRIVVHAYPVFDWLDYALSGSVVVSWLTTYLGFIAMMLPEVFRHGASYVSELIQLH